MATVNLGFDGVYTSFSGADAVVSFNGRNIGEIQAITVNCQREKGPVYVMGSPDPISFSRGKRGIAGNLVFVMFDRNALIEEMEKFAAQNGTIPQYTAAGNVLPTGLNVPTPVTVAGQYTGLPLNSQYSTLATVVQYNLANTSPNSVPGSVQQQGSAFIQLHGQQPGEFWTYDDQIPPFDITVTLANEYGAAAYLTIEKAEILNEGMGISIDDITTERACTFVARRMQRMRRGFNVTGSANTSTPSSKSFTLNSQK